MTADMRELLADDSDREEGEMTPETLSPRGEFMELDARGDVNYQNGAASKHSVESLANVHEADNAFEAEVRTPSPPPVAIVHRSQLLNAMNAPLPPLAAGQHSPETAAPNILSMQQPAQVPAQLPSLAPLPPQQTLTQQQIAQAAKKARQRAHKRAKLAQEGAADSSTPAGMATPPSDEQNHAHIAAQEATKRAVAAFLSQQEHILSVAPPSGPVVRHESLVISFDDDDFHSSDQLPAQAGLVPKQGQRVLTDLEVKMAQLRAQIAKQERPPGVEKASPASSAPASPPLIVAAPPAKPLAFFAPRPPAVRAPAKPQVTENGTAANRRSITSTSKAAHSKAFYPTSQPKAPAMRSANGATSTAHPSTASQASIGQRTAHPAPMQQTVVALPGMQGNGSAEQMQTTPESAQSSGAGLPSASQAVAIRAARSQPTDKSVLPRHSSRSPPADNPPAATTNSPVSQSGVLLGIAANQPSSEQNAAQVVAQSNPSAEHQPAVPGVGLSSLAAQLLENAVQPAAQTAPQNNPSAEHEPSRPVVPSSSPGGEASLSPPALTPSPVPVQVPETQVPPNPQVVAQPDTKTTPKQAATPSKPPSAGKRRSVKRSAASSSPAGIAKLAADVGPMKRLRQLSGIDFPRNTRIPDGQPQQPDAARNGSPERAVPEQAVAAQSEPKSPERASSEQAVAVQSEPQSPNAIQAALVDAEDKERNMQSSLYNQQAAVRRLEVRKARLLAELLAMDAALDVEKQRAAEYQQNLLEASAAVSARHSQLLHSVQQAVPVFHALGAPPSDVQASSSRQKPPVVVERKHGILALPQSTAQARVPVPITVPHAVAAALQAEGGAAATDDAGAARTASIDVAEIDQSHTPTVDITTSVISVAQHAAVQHADAPASMEPTQQPASHAAAINAMNEQGAVSQPTSISPLVKQCSTATQQTARPRYTRHRINSQQRATPEASPRKIVSPLREGNPTSSSQGTMPPKQATAEAALKTTVTSVQGGSPTSSQRSMPPKQAQPPPIAPVARKAVSEASAVPVASPRSQSSLRVSVSASPCTITSSAQPAASSPQQLQAERSEAEKSLRALEMTLQQQRQLALSAEKARLLASSQKRNEEPSQGPSHTGPQVQLAPSPRTSGTRMCMGTEDETKLQSTPATASAPSADASAEPAHASVQVTHTGPEVQPTPSPRTSGAGMRMGIEAETQFNSTPATAEPPHANAPSADGTAEPPDASVQLKGIKKEQLSSPLDAGCVEDGTIQAAAESAIGPLQLPQSRTQQQETQAISAVAAAEDAAAAGPEEPVLAASKSPERSRNHGASEPVPARVAFPDNGLRNQPSFSTWLKPQGAQPILPSSRPALVFANSSAFPSIRISTPDMTQSVHAANNPPAELKPYSSPLPWFRSSRLLRQYQHAWHKSLQSATFTHSINANKPLCPYDLRGKCNDKDCAKQHQEQYICTEKQALQDLNNLLDAAREHVKGKQISKARSVQELERLLDSEKSSNILVFGRRVGFRVRMSDAEVGTDGLLGEEVPKYYLLNYHETAFSILSDYWFDFGDTAAASSWVLPAVGSLPNPHMRADNSARLAAKRDQRYYKTDNSAPSPTDMQHAEQSGTDEDEVAALEKHIQDNPTDCEARVALAVKCHLRYDPVHASKQAQEEALKALAKALDIAPQNVAIWWVYLHLFCKRQDATEAAEMLGYGVQYCRFSYELWCFVIGNAESVSTLQDISYRAMVWLSASVLLSTDNGHPGITDSSSSRALAPGLDSWQHKSACLLDIALRLLAALSMAGQSELALVWVNELVSLAETPPASRPVAYKPSPQQVQDPNLAAVSAEPHALIGLLTALHPRDLCVLWLAAAHSVVQGALPKQVAERLGYQQDLLVIDWPAVDKSENWDATQGALVERLFTAASRDWQGCMGVYSEAGGSASTQNDILEARECFAANAVLWTHAMSGAQVAIKTSTVLIAHYPTNCQLLRLHLTLLSATSGLTEVAAVVHKALIVAVKGQLTAGFHKSISDFLALCLQDQPSAAAAVDALLHMLRPQKVSLMQGGTSSQEHAIASPRESLARLLQVYNFVSSRVRVSGDDEAYRHINLACLHSLDSNAEAALAAMHEAIKAANSSNARQRVAKEYLALLQLLSSSPTSVVSALCDLIAPDVRMLQPLAQPLQGFDDQRLQDVCTPPALMDCNGWTGVLLQLLKENPIFVQNTSIWVEAIEASLLLMPSELSIALGACKKVFAPAAKGMRQEHLPACVWALRLAYESLLHAKQTAGDAAWEEIAQYCLAIEATDTSVATCKQGLKLYPFSVKLRQQYDIGVQTAAGEAQAGASARR